MRYIDSMDAPKDPRLLVIGGLTLLAIFVSVVAYLFLAPVSPKMPAEQVPAIDTGPDVGAQVSGAVQTPAEQLPQTNPFSSYKNPFE